MNRPIPLTALLLVSAIIGLQADSAKHSAIDPNPKGNERWKQRAESINRNVSENPDTQLVFIGDSITQGWEGAGREVWEKHYAPYHAVNLGIGGDRTQHVLYRLQNGNLEGISPKAAVVMIGTNNSNNYDNTAKQIAEGVGEIVKTLRSKVPDTKVLLLGVFPRGENINEQRGKLLQINQILAKHHDGENVHFLDIGHHFITMEGLIPSDIMPDYLHLSPKGYEIWAEAIAPHLVELIGESEPTIADSPLIGKWVFVIAGPDGTDVDMPLNIELKDGKIGGSIGGERRSFPIENGEIDGNTIRFSATRDRPNGGTMTYHIEGELDDETLKGNVTAEIEGQEIEQPWKAHRAE